MSVPINQVSIFFPLLPNTEVAWIRQLDFWPAFLILSFKSSGCSFQKIPFWDRPPPRKNCRWRLIYFFCVAITVATWQRHRRLSLLTCSPVTNLAQHLFFMVLLKMYFLSFHCFSIKSGLLVSRTPKKNSLRKDGLARSYWSSHCD